MRTLRRLLLPVALVFTLSGCGGDAACFSILGVVGSCT
jgi:hypothetical protein